MTTKNCLPGESRFFVTRIENFLFAFSFFFFFFFSILALAMR